jgi:PDZ domain
MRSPLVVVATAAALAAGCATDQDRPARESAPPVAEAPEAQAAGDMGGSAAAEAGAAAAAPAPQLGEPTRDGKAHRWELRAFADSHVEVWMDGVRVPDERIVRDAHRVAVTDASGTVIERLDMPKAWTPAHGTPDAPGTYRRTDGVVLVPPASMLGGRLEPVPPAVLAHLRAEHTAADGSRCAYVARVIPGLPLDAAGVHSHDVVVSVNGSDDASPDSVRAAVRAAKPGDTVRLVVLRAGQRIDAAVTLAAWDPKHMVRMAGQVDPPEPASASSAPVAAQAAPAPAPAPEPAAPNPAADDLAAARRRIAELEAQVRKEDAVHRAIRPAPMPQPSAGGAAPN